MLEMLNFYRNKIGKLMKLFELYQLYFQFRCIWERTSWMDVWNGGNV